MAIIDPEGLFEGERLAECSDQAQLYWPRLFIAANGFGRIELSYSMIVSRVFRHFRNPPTEQQLWAIFEELAENFLVVLYESNGVWWAQFLTSEKYLPKYKTIRDSATPAPPESLVQRAFSGYQHWKRSKSLGPERFRRFTTETPEASIEEEPQPEVKGRREQLTCVEEIVCLHPRSRLRGLRRNEVRQQQRDAVWQAMREEMQSSKVDEMEALRRIRTRLERLIEVVPQDRWKYFKDVPEFFRNHDDRVDPEEYRSGKRGEATNAKQGNRADATVESVLTGTRAALARLSGMDRNEVRRTGGHAGRTDGQPRPAPVSDGERVERSAAGESRLRAQSLGARR